MALRPETEGFTRQRPCDVQLVEGDIVLWFVRYHTWTQWVGVCFDVVKHYFVTSTATSHVNIVNNRVIIVLM